MIQLKITAAFIDRLITKGYGPSYEAGPLRKEIARLVEDPLAEAILAGHIQVSDTAVVGIDDDSQVQVQATGC